MAGQQASKPRKFRYGNDAFPILYEDHNLSVYTNGSGEIFVESKRDKNATIRVTPDGNGVSITAHGGRLVPWAVNGLSAILVRGRGA